MPAALRTSNAPCVLWDIGGCALPHAAPHPQPPHRDARAARFAHKHAWQHIVAWPDAHIVHVCSVMRDSFRRDMTSLTAPSYAFWSSAMFSKRGPGAMTALSVA